MLIAYTYKLNPSSSQRIIMGQWLDMLCSLYNFALRERIEAYEQVKTPHLGNYSRIESQGECCPLACSVSKSTLYGIPWKIDHDGVVKKRSAFEVQCSALPKLKENRPWYKAINAQVLQQCLRQLDTAFKNFFEHSQGFPSFKRRSRFRSLSYPPGAGVHINGTSVKLPGIGWMRFFNSRPIPDGFSIRTVTVRRKANGWYLSVQLEDKSIPVLPVLSPGEVTKPVGVDLGVRKLAALSSGPHIPNPRFQLRVERRNRIRHRRASHKLKGSRNRAKAYQALARLEQRISNQRSDYLWKVANLLNREGDCIIFEDLNIKGMVKRAKSKQDEHGKFICNGQVAKSGLNKAILDAAWGELKLKTRAVAAKLGNLVWETNSRKTSQECKLCHFVSPSNRDKEKFLCESCGHLDDADNNASSNILMRGCVELGIRVAGVPGEFTPLEKSLTLVDEPGNPRNREESLSNQLSESPSIPQMQLGGENVKNRLPSSSGFGMKSEQVSLCRTIRVYRT